MSVLANSSLLDAIAASIEEEDSVETYEPSQIVGVAVFMVLICSGGCCCVLQFFLPCCRIFGMARWGPEYFLVSFKGQLVLLFVIACILMLFSTITWMLGGGTADANSTFLQSFWFAWCLFIDPGTQTGIGADAPRKVKFIGVMNSIFGFVFVLIFTGFVIDVMRQKMDQWRTKYRRVVANDHILILGWSSKVPFLLDEIASNYKHQAIKVVILSDQEEDYMTSQIVKLRADVSNEDPGKEKMGCCNATPFGSGALITKWQA